jgi:hypothetical protein
MVEIYILDCPQYIGSVDATNGKAAGSNPDEVIGFFS